MIGERLRSTISDSLPVLKIAADILAIMVAVALPWSTSATGVLVAIWLLVVMPTLDRSAWLKNILSLTGGLPVLLFILALAGMFWSDVSITNKVHALHPYARLLMIPPLLTQFSRNRNGHRVLLGFLISCSLLLALSLATAVRPTIWRPDNPGVPVKDQIAQSAEFVICGFCLLYLAILKRRSSKYNLSVLLFVSSAIFFCDVFWVATSRTELVAIAAITILLFVKVQGWKSLPLALLSVVLLGAAVWSSSGYIRDRVSHGIWEVEQFEASDRPTSIGLRFEWWQKSIGFIRRAPIFGNGTGSTQKLFRESAAGKTGASGFIVVNPHNQVLAIAIPLGLVGVTILFAMWIAHILLFRDSGPLAWIGLVVVCQTIIGSIFNSHLFDVTEGWIYVWGVGVLGGMVLGEKSRAALRSPTEFERT
jgi:O-antigen ligase